MEPLVDIVIVTRNTRELTLRCVESVVDSGVARCIVVDNASTDGTAEALERVDAGVVVVRSSANLGYGTACNLGAREGTAELLLVLNSDIVGRPGAVMRLVEHMTAHPDHVAAGGCLVDAGTDRPQAGFVIRGFPTLGGQIAILTGLERLWPRNPVSRRASMLDFDFARTQVVDGQPAGACLACRRAAFEGVGGFDEGFYYWFEDVDLVRRLADRGQIAYVHDAVFEHVGGATFSHWPRPEIVSSRYESLLRYFERHHSRAELLALRSVVTLVTAVRVPPLALLDPPSSRAYARVFMRALRGA